ncbi:MAG: choice-of-anchor Q domain-containing protein, partial [Kiritimatiellae bacterium]|nr:choice-of-anchor Q domain-containing protein [Kiritimatiellia bacterium]
MPTNVYSSGTEGMKRLLVCGCLLLLCPVGWADTHYVNIEGTLSTYPYTSWMTAANTIQEGVDAASSGDTVMVYDGVYEVGGAAAIGDSLSNRVCITKGITVMSLNGPEVTIIRGAGSLASNAVRCVLLDGGAVLSGFTLTDGATLPAVDEWERDRAGGGVLAVDGSVTNCILVDNSAGYGGGASGGALLNCVVSGNSAQFGGGAIYSTLSECYVAENSADFGGAVYESEVVASEVANNTASTDGGGAYGGALYGCQISGNEAGSYGGGTAFSVLDRCAVSDNLAAYGGGSYEGGISNSLICYNLAAEGGGCNGTYLQNCTVVQNDASDEAGGVYEGTLINCIVYDNYSGASDGHNYYGASMSYSCTEPALAGAGNISAAPGFEDGDNGDFHLAIDSPCIDVGDDASVTDEYDLDGNVRIQGDAVDMGAYEYRYCQIYASATEYGTIDPSGDVYVRSGASQTFSMTPKTYGVMETLEVNGEFQEPVEEFVWESITEDGYISAGFVVDGSLERIHYVWTNSPSPEFPYASWDTAAHVIQDAADAAWDGATVLVTNGVYNTGGARMEDHELFSRVCVTSRIEMRSVNGPEVTIIEGEGPLGSNAVRGVFLVDGSLLSGFTVRNGYTMIGETGSGHDLCGGGILSYAGTVDHCILKDNTANDLGGGMYMWDALVQDSIFEGNEAGEGGGLFGDGSDTNKLFIDGVATNCCFYNNTARYAGGGVSFVA